jgi:hypothetical protein
MGEFMTSINFSLEPRDVAFVPIQLGHFLIPLLQTGAMLLRAASGWQRLVVAGNYCVYTIMKRNSSGTMPKTVLERKKKKNTTCSVEDFLVENRRRL